MNNSKESSLKKLTCLSAGHQVTISSDDRYGIFLNRCWLGILTQLNVNEKNTVYASTSHPVTNNRTVSLFDEILTKKLDFDEKTGIKEIGGNFPISE